MTGRNLIGDAFAALDQSLTVADDRTGFDRDYWLQRAAVNAAIAQAQQSRLSNLIAWKQLRQSASPSTLPGSGDAITQEIEDALGITDPETETDPGEDRPVVMLVPGTLAADLAAEVFREHVADMGADDPVGRAKDIATLSAMADALEGDA